MIGINPYYQNELLNYTSYIAIEKYKRKNGRCPSGLFFNKVMSLANEELKNKGINIELPHYWYRYGDQVHKAGMPSAIIWNHENPTKTNVDWSSNKPYTHTDTTYRIINRTIQDLINKYSGKNKQIIQEVYKNAPYEFQRDILELRGIIFGWRNALNWDTNSYRTISKEVILNSLDSFPKDDFPNVIDEYTIIKKILIKIMEKNDWDFQLFKYISQEFWFYFCYHLRLKKNASENIPKEVLAYWESQIDFEKLRFRRLIGDVLININKLNPTIKNDAILRKEFIWRRKDLEETNKLIDDFINSA